MKEQTTNITLQQKKFCENFVSEAFFGNGVQSYINTYKVNLKRPGAYKMAKAAASRLLTNVNLLAYINELLENAGFNDQFVDKQLLFLITQNADYPSKIAAIREYNKLKQRITDKVDTSREPTVVLYLPDNGRGGSIQKTP